MQLEEEKTSPQTGKQEVRAGWLCVTYNTGHLFPSQGCAALEILTDLHRVFVVRPLDLLVEVFVPGVDVLSQQKTKETKEENGVVNTSHYVRIRQQERNSRPIFAG